MKARLHFTAGILLRNKVKSLLFLCAVATVWIIFSSYASGAAKSGAAVTGAPFNNSQTCGMCHGGGDFGGSINTELLDATNTAVTEYTPGQVYTFKITMNGTAPEYGFQTTAATVAGSVNQNTWGTLPLHTQNISVSGRNYIEQSTALGSNVVSIPWTAPAAGKGSIIFYTAGNLVDGSGGTEFDQPVNTSLTVTEGSTMPVTIAWFKGAVKNNAAVLTWATAQELNNKIFVIEKSYNGADFVSIAQIPTKGNTVSGYSYSYTDNSFRYASYYRLKQVDMDGKEAVYSVVNLKSASLVQYDLSVYCHSGTSFVRFYNGAGKQQRIHIIYTDLTGRRIYENPTSANEGYNVWPIEVIRGNSVMIVTVITEDGARISKKFITTR